MTTRVRNLLLITAFCILGSALIWIFTLDPDGFFVLGIYIPMMIDAGLGFSVGLLSNRAVWRFLAWPVIPVGVVYVYNLTCAPGVGASAESRGGFGLALIYLVVTGMVMSGLACILGYYARVRSLEHDPSQNTA